MRTCKKGQTLHSENLAFFCVSICFYVSLYCCKPPLTLNTIAALSRDLSLYQILPHFCWQHRDPAASLQRFSP